MSKEFIVEKRALKKPSVRTTVNLDENVLRLIAERSERDLLKKAENIVSGKVQDEAEVIIEWR
jgi:hypothetical protein